MHPQFPIRLVQLRQLAPTVFHYVFRRADGQSLEFIPGQFIQVHFDLADGTSTKRSYSLATRRDRAKYAHDTVSFAVSFVPGGRATALFESLQAGDELQCSGPYGRFVLNERDTNTRYLLIGTGTGITPYRAMLPQLKQLMDERGISVSLLQGARTQAELLYGDEFAEFAAENPKFTYFPCLSRETPNCEGTNVHPIYGYVQQALSTLAPQAEGDIAYLCGNPDMVDACFAFLKEQGMSTQFIRREKYVSNV